MKYFFQLLFVLNSYLVFSSKNYINYAESIFVNKGSYTLKKVFKNSIEIKNKVEYLFNKDLLDHEYTKAYAINADFKTYWSKNESNWKMLDMNKDSIFEFIYCYETNESKENNFIEIYFQQSGKLKLLFKEKGSLIAYKIQPNTKEIILFHHKYPCCRTVSHNINMIRMVNNKIHLRKKYFVLNPEDTSFKIFPNYVQYSSKYYYLKKNKKIFSSTKSIMQHSKKSIIGIYPKNTPFRILFSEKKWKYVLMCGTPINSTKSKTIINPENFTQTHVFGWLSVN